jgi:hypothetical protein
LAGGWGNARLKEKTFFGSFFQKRTNLSWPSGLALHGAPDHAIYVQAEKEGAADWIRILAFGGQPGLSKGGRTRLRSAHFPVA